MTGPHDDTAHGEGGGEPATGDDAQTGGDGHDGGDETRADHAHDGGGEVGGAHAHDDGGANHKAEAEDSHGHDHAAVYDTDTWWGRLRAWLAEWCHGLYHSMIEAPAMENVEMAAEDAEDAFLFACFADAFGIPSPVSYYTVELLPYLAEAFEQFERRMWDRESLLERKGEQYHVH